MQTVRRHAGRVLLLDPAGRVLLLRGGDPDRPQDGTWWFTVGGGCAPGEDTRAAARREAREEVGVDPGELGNPVGSGQLDFVFMDVHYLQDEDYFVATMPAGEISRDGWTQVERQVLLEHRWWTLAELRDTDETVYPTQLADLLEQHLTEQGQAAGQADG